MQWRAINTVLVFVELLSCVYMASLHCERKVSWYLSKKQTFCSRAVFWTRTADLYLKHCFDSSYKYALWSGAKILFWKTSEVSETGSKNPTRGQKHSHEHITQAIWWRQKTLCFFFFFAYEKKFHKTRTICPGRQDTPHVIFRRLTNNNNVYMVLQVAE